VWRVGNVVVRVDVRKMGRVGEVAMEKKGKQEVLDLWREEGRENVETYLWSGRILKGHFQCIRIDAHVRVEKAINIALRMKCNP
jgi:hypothetical protein